MKYGLVDSLAYRGRATNDPRDVSNRPHELAPGQRRRHVMLGTEAVYPICAVRHEIVDVEAVRAPGLPAGQRFAFTREAVVVMELLRSPARRID
jgi:hypothetical protein